MLAQHLGKTISLGNVTHDQTIGGIRDGCHVALDKIVVGDRIMSMMQQPPQASTANVSGAPGQQNLH
jgi:hypothetical protein